MAKTLILTEKPSVAQDIASSLGGFEKHQDYFESKDAFITWAVGHLVSLAEPDDYDKSYKYWTLQSLPIVPKVFELKPIPRSEGRLKTIRALSRDPDVKAIINACDAGREGELIFRYITEYLGLKQHTKRLWLQSMTKSSIVVGFKKLRDSEELDNLGASAKCRSEADWLIGINATRAFTRRLGNLLSIGRVQTPTMAIVAMREKQISAFVPQTYYEVFARFKAKSGDYLGKWFLDLPKDSKKKDANLTKAQMSELAEKHGQVFDSAMKFNGDAKQGDRLETLSSRKAAEVITKAIEGKEGEVTLEERKTQTQASHLLFDLNELQRECNRRFGYSAARTLQIAQVLYEEKKLLTYPRTDSKHLPEDYVKVVPEIFDMLSMMPFGEIVRPLLGQKIAPKKRIFDNKKISDHFAIIPTEKSPGGAGLNPDQVKVYDLIVKRFVAAFYPDAVWELIHRETTVEGHTFRSDTKFLKEPGFFSVYGREVEEDEPLPACKVGDKVKTISHEIQEKQTKPPPRYNEATLLGAMEGAGKFIDDEELKDAMKEKGLGTPATRASIIERLIEVGYIERVGRDIVATSKGVALYDLLMAFPLPELCSPEMTGEWEYKLACIEKGQLEAGEFMDGIITFTRQLVEKVKERSFDTPIMVQDENGELKIVGKCPICGGDVVDGFMSFRCSNYKPKKGKGKAKKTEEEGEGCAFAIWKTIAGKIITEDIAKELIEKGQVGPLTGFRSRSGRPFSATLLLEKDGKITFQFDNTRSEKGVDKKEEVGGAPVAMCAVCGGKVLDTGSSYRCENYKKSCNFSMSKVILEKVITLDQLQNLVQSKKTDKLTGFFSRKGRPFSAFLVLDDKGKVGFEFDNGNGKTAKSAANKRGAKGKGKKVS